MLIIAIILFIILCYVISKRNSFNKLRRAVKQQGADIGIQISKRTACLNDALSIAKNSYEKEVAGIEKLTPSNQVEKLRYLGEMYPELMSIHGYQKALEESFDLNRDIAATRELLNGNIREYNDAITDFPGLIVAAIFGYKKETFIDEENIEENKKIDKNDVDFSKF